MKAKNCNKLTLDDRINIQAYIAKGLSLSAIARKLGKSKSTISREISRNSKTDYNYTKCQHQLICNLCPRQGLCLKPKRYYDCNYANKQARDVLIISRTKSQLSNDKILLINSILSKGIQQTKSLHHVYIANPILSTICCERTCRRLIYNNYLPDCKPYMLRRYIRFNHNKKSDSNPEPPRFRNIKAYAGRTYSDYIKYTTKHKSANIAQFDSVIGTVNDKYAILTISFPKYEFQFGLYIKKGDTQDVNKKLYHLFKRLGPYLTNKLFAVCLCDNGFEFESFPNIENYGYNIKTFYTRTYNSSDKGACENYHRYLRYIYPKGKSLDHISQEDLDDSFSNICNFIRVSINDLTPYRLMVKKFGLSLLRGYYK